MFSYGWTNCTEGHVKKDVSYNYGQALLLDHVLLTFSLDPDFLALSLFHPETICQHV
jgi:hypothetical protein